VVSRHFSWDANRLGKQLLLITAASAVRPDVIHGRVRPTTTKMLLLKLWDDS